MEMEEAHEPNTTRDLPNRPLPTNLQRPAINEFVAHVEASTDLEVTEVRAETELGANVEAPASHAREGSVVARDEATDEGDDSDTQIYDVVIECLNLFQETGAMAQGSVGDRILIPVPQDDLGKVTEGVNEYEPISVRDCVARLSGSFGHWSDYTGALTLPQTSLDNRLQDHREIKMMIIELLDMIARNLNRSQCPNHQYGRPHNDLTNFQRKSSRIPISLGLMRTRRKPSLAYYSLSKRLSIDCTFLQMPSEGHPSRAIDMTYQALGEMMTHTLNGWPSC
jgi:hypothetical protein